MDSEHQASNQHSPPPWSESPETGSLASNRSISRTISTTSLNTITHLPRYSVLEGQQSVFDQEVNTGTLLDDELYTRGETPSSRRSADNVDTTTLADDTLQGNSNMRASVASVSPPRYSFTPPRYSGVFGIPAQQVTTDGVSRTEHTYNICGGLKNKPWATFRVFSQPPLGALQKHQKFPRFSGGDMIAGLVEFKLDNSQTVNSIVVSLRGRIIRGSLAGESDTFLDHQVTVWTRASGDPRFPIPGSTKRFDGKLKGEYQFPFAFPFPTHVDISTSTAISLPLQSPSDPFGTPSSPSSPNAIASPSTSSSFPPAVTTPRTSWFRSFSSPSSASFASRSEDAASMHMSTHQFTCSHLSGMSTANISLSRPRKKSLYRESQQNEFNSFPVPKSPEESEKARLKRALEEQDRTQAQLEVNSSKALSAHVYPTPQTFLERGIHANVQYDLCLHITHGMLRPASKLKTAIVYTPSITPPSASAARQRAYTEGAPLPGPVTDPDGWLTLPKVTVHGELLGQRRVEVECTLSLAKPLCYTRGSVIPCYLTLESSNSHALGLLSTPKSPFVRLTRRVRYSQDGSSTIDSVSDSSELSTPFGTLSGDSVKPTAGLSTSSRPGGNYVNVVGGGKCGNMTQEIDEVDLAVWWVPPKDAPQEMCLKRLEGEIHLAKDLQPTCRFLPFSVEYAVEMLPLVSHAFEPIRSEREKCLLVQPVEIATHHSEGPMPTTFTEPTSDRERERRKKEKEKAKERVEVVMGRSPFES